jgi:hypothetical protein
VADEKVVKAGCLLLETLRSGRVGIVRENLWANPCKSVPAGNGSICDTDEEEDE